MAISRRRFIKSGSLVVLSAGLPLKVAAELLNRPGALVEAGASGPTTTNGSKLNLSTFSKFVKTDFQLSGPGVATIRARLVEVRDLKSQEKGSVNEKSNECFSTVFVASASAPLGQGTYTVEHSSLGKFSMFLVPSRRSPNGIQYEAVFNRL